MSEPRGLLTWSIFATIVASSMVQGALGPLLPLIGADLPMNHTVESFHITGLAAGGMITAFIIEPVRRRIGRWRVIFGAAGISMVAAVLLNQATSPVMTVTGITLVGIGVSGVIIAGQTLLVARHPGRGAKFIGEANVAFSVGAVAATASLPLIAVWWGWRSFPIAQLLLLAAVAAPLLLASRGEAREVPERTLHDPQRTAAAARRPRFAYVALCSAIAVEWSLIFWLPIYLTQVTGLAELLAAQLTAILFIAMVVARFAGSALMNRIGPTPVLIGSALMSILTVGILLVTTTAGVAGVVAALVGIATANLYPAGMALVVAAHPARADHAVARASVLLSVTVIFFPIVLGRLGDLLGLQRAFLTIPFLALTAVAAVILTGIRPRLPVAAAPLADQAR